MSCDFTTKPSMFKALLALKRWHIEHWHCIPERVKMTRDGWRLLAKQAAKELMISEGTVDWKYGRAKLYGMELY